MRRGVLLLGLALMLVRPAQGQQVTAAATYDSTHIRIGEWFRATLTVTAPGTMRIALPRASEDFEHAEPVSSGPEKVEEKDGRKTVTKQYVLTRFDTGRAPVVLIVRAYAPGDTVGQRIRTNPWPLTVTTVPIDTAKEYRDIKDVMHVSLTFWEWMLIIGAVLAVLAGIWFGYRWYTRRPVAVPVEPVAEDVRPPHEIAFEKLRLLEARKLWEGGAHKPFQSELTGILREYIERAYGVPALEQTTGEIIGGIALCGFAPDLVAKLEQVLRLADMTKFATYVPTPGEHVVALRIAYEFIERTRPPVLGTGRPSGEAAHV